MSKVYALSGLRAAYLVAPRHLLEGLRAVTPPWAVSLPAQVAAVAALLCALIYMGGPVSQAHYNPAVSLAFRLRGRSGTRALWAYAGTQFGVLLPFSRQQESEADRLGLVFMAMAGYQPAGAVDFWQRMAQQSGGQAPPEFMSTHPSDETRIAQIKEALPEAMKYYKPVK